MIPNKSDAHDVAGWRLTLEVPQANAVHAVVAVAISDRTEAEKAIRKLVTGRGSFEPMTAAEVAASGLGPDEVGQL